MTDNQERIWHIVARIPSGKVATYGQVAEYAGLPGRARLVGHTLARLPADSALPWHRVVNSQGRLSFPAGGEKHARQRNRLEAEGIPFQDGRIPLRRCRWRL
ncbi:MAG: MGMT family protein [Gammaproteobacteria bacterium]|nr:MGMT family protein [Gammaproteobacteria bacterium]